MLYPATDEEEEREFEFGDLPDDGDIASAVIETGPEYAKGVLDTLTTILDGHANHVDDQLYKVLDKLRDSVYERRDRQATEKEIFELLDQHNYEPEQVSGS